MAIAYRAKPFFEVTEPREYSFREQIEEGAIGIRLVEEWCYQHFPGCLPQTPHREDTDRMGIDLFLHYEGEISTIQVKTDHKTVVYGNVFIETISDKDRNIPGWIHTTIASYLAYVCPEIDLMYWVPFERVQEAFKAHWEGREEKAVSNCDKRTGRRWTTYGIPVKKEEFQLLTGAESYDLRDIPETDAFSEEDE